MAQSSDSGAHFHRTDLQVHTPRDVQWHGPRPVSAEERAAFAVRFVTACRVRQLHAVAITDHHDFALFPFIKQAAAKEIDDTGLPLSANERLAVFPGLELTLDVPCQALLILDADFREDKLASVLDHLGIDGVDHAEAKLPDVKRLTTITDLQQLHDKLNERDWLRDRYIVLPNVTDGGHATLMRPGMSAKYRNMRNVGGYLDGSIDKLSVGKRRIFDGLEPQYGSRRLGLFQTSDSRTDTFDDLGVHSTWIKWSAPIAEAIRQACLAHDSRISQRPPQLSSIAISRISVTRSKFLGHLDICLNPQYSPLIGGRGTGKSTILDYLRWALCDQPTGVEGDEVGNPLARRDRLIALTLKPYDGQVEVRITINDIQHVVRRRADTGETFLKVGSAEMQHVSEDEVRSLLPVHAYSQKQLSSVAVRAEGLRRFVTAPIQSQLDDNRHLISETAGRLRENYATSRRSRDLQSSVRVVVRGPERSGFSR